MNRQSFAGILLILSAAMLWGTTGTAQSFTPLTLSSYWVGSLRLLVAGVVLCLLSGLSYAVYAMATKHIVATTSPGLATASVFTLAALIALPAAALLAGKPLVSTSDAAVSCDWEWWRLALRICCSVPGCAGSAVRPV